MAEAPKEGTEGQGRSLLSPSSVFRPSQLVCETLARLKEWLCLPHALLESSQQGTTVACPRGGEQGLGFARSSAQMSC